MDGTSIFARAGLLTIVVILAAAVVILVMINGHLASLASHAEHQSGFACMTVIGPELYSVNGQAHPDDCLTYALEQAAAE